MHCQIKTIKNMKANDLSRFKFEYNGTGCYKVYYFTPNRGDFWVATINNMTMIDGTKNAEWAKAKDIEHLRNVVKRLGFHYNSDGNRIV